MIYRNSEMKIDQLVSYLNDEKINLSPVFQRGHVWSVSYRRSLIRNMVQGRPIPAIFLYKEASGSRYSYNILDGKQRLESLILFIGHERPEFKIERWDKYFFSKKERKDVNFWIDLPPGKSAFSALSDAVVRDFREYAIPTIEINLTDDSSLDEIINLFVDINQQGVPVNRFDIVKAMGSKNALLRSVFSLIALQETRGQDVHYKIVKNEFTAVLRHLQIVSSLVENSQVDRMWERLLEIALYSRTRKHRKPVEILKSFIGLREKQSKLIAIEQKTLRAPFRFLATAYRDTTLGASRLATDQTHFYTMMTALIGGDNGQDALLSADLDEDGKKELVQRLIKFARIIDGEPLISGKRLAVAKVIKDYLDLSTKQTTDVSRRLERQIKFKDAIKMLPMDDGERPEN